MRIALIQDGTEVARQSYADVATTFANACATIPAQDNSWEIDAYADESVAYFLDGLTPKMCSCVVVASNALLSESVRSALRNGIDELHRYIAQGGGLVVLHQLVDDIGWLLPYEMEIRLIDRQTTAEMTARSQDQDDVLLWFPHQVDPTDLKDAPPRARGETIDGTISNAPKRMYWRYFEATDLEARLKPVLRFGDNEWVIARSDTTARENVVLCSIPLDWHGRSDLIANLLTYAARGKPDRLVWRAGEARDQKLEALVDARHSAAFRPMPDFSSPVPSIDAWLLRQVHYCVVPNGESLDVLARLDVGREFVEGGGALVAVKPHDLGNVTWVDALLGSQLERSAIPEFYTELHAIDGWQTPAYAFELRNIVSMLHLAWESPIDCRVAISPSSLVDVKKEVRRRLDDRVHREDFGSSLALAQAYWLMGASSKEATQATDWLHERLTGRTWDVQIQVGSIRLRIDRGDPSDFLCAIERHIADETTTVAAVARVCDAVAFCGLGPGDVDLRRAASALARRLDSEPMPTDAGWLSAEATADISRGLAALHRVLPADADERDALEYHMISAQRALRAVLPRYERVPKGIAWRARIVEALILIDRELPPSLDRLGPLMSLDQSPSDSHSADGVARHLADANLKLRERIDSLSHDQVAAHIGRVIANFLAAAAILAGTGLVAFELAGASASNVLSAVGGAGATVLLLTIVVATLLDLGNLLYPWAQRPFERARRGLVSRYFGD
jgi:hypothetical protein